MIDEQKECTPRSARSILHDLPIGADSWVCKTTIEMVYGKREKDGEINWIDTECYAEENHPALVKSISTWWWEQSSPRDVARFIDQEGIKYGQVKSQELAAVFCAAACSQYAEHRSVADCIRTRLAWIRGEASDEDRAAAKRALQNKFNTPEGNQASRAAERDDGICGRKRHVEHSMDAAAQARSFRVCHWPPSPSTRGEALELGRNRLENYQQLAKVIIASSLRTLFPDPTRMDWRDSIRRWEEALRSADAAFEEAEETERKNR